MAQKRQKVAAFALNKSVAYSYFLDEALKTGRKTATTVLWRASCGAFAQTRRNGYPLKSGAHKLLILKENYG